jgi:NAD(P)-dependent dehydrogenase (short-subunit alcohol dehydrogenase family)
MGTKLQDKVVVVTGASSGFGRAIAKACAAEGAKVVVSDVHENPNAGGFEDDAALTTVEAIEKLGGAGTYVGSTSPRRTRSTGSSRRPSAPTGGST